MVPLKKRKRMPLPTAALRRSQRHQPPPPPPPRRNPTRVVQEKAKAEAAAKQAAKPAAKKKQGTKRKATSQLKQSQAKKKVPPVKNNVANVVPVILSTTTTANTGTSTSDLLDNDDERHVFWSDMADNQFNFEFLANLGVPLRAFGDYWEAKRQLFECYGMTKNLTLSELQVLRAGWIRKLYSLFGNHHFLVRKHQQLFNCLNFAYKELREELIANNPPTATPTMRQRVTVDGIPMIYDDEEQEKKKSTNTRRKMKTRPIELHDYKDQSVRDKFKKCAKEMNVLHIQSTFVDRAKMDINPQSKHFMFTYDEAVERPRYKKYGGNAVGKRRKNPRTAFLVPDRHLSHQDFGRILIDAGLEIILGNEANSVAICTTPEQYYRAVFGEDESKPKAKGGKKKQSIEEEKDDASELLLSSEENKEDEKEEENKEDEKEEGNDDDSKTASVSEDYLVI